ncbi:MAG: DUF3187 family protein [Nitrospirota bacterium]
MRVSACARGILAGIVVGLLFVWAGDAAAEGYGPFPVRNFQPLQMLFLGMPGDRAAVLKKGALDVRVELADTATVFDDRILPTTATMKFEQLRSGLFLRYGLTEKLEVAVEVPAVYRYRGILEGAITGVERATTGLAPARKSLENRGYVYNVSRNGNVMFSGSNNTLGLGDTTFIGKYQLLTEDHGWTPTLSLRVAAKAPTGDSAQFFGSGHPDFGVGVAVEKAVATNWLLYGNFNVVQPTGTVSNLSLQTVLTGIGAVEYLWSPALSFVAQFDYYSSAYHGTGSPVLDRGVTEAAFGFNYELRRNLLWQVYGIENLDILRGSAADFTLSTVVTYRFGN